MTRKLLIPLALFTLPACRVDVVNTKHCSLNEGDAYCAELFPERPMCNSPLRTDECDIGELGLEVARYGCVSPEELKCHEPCGTDPNCEGVEASSSSGGETETEATTIDPSSTTGPGTDTDTEEPVTTTGGECTVDGECLDPALPFCVDESCSPCSAVVDITPDEACAELDPAAPLCVEDACAQCSAEDASACGGTTPLCDDTANTCVGCSFHEECQDQEIGPACNIATGACFDPTAVSMVDAGVAGSIQPAIDAVADGAEHAIVLDGGGQGQTIAIDGGKTIAIVSDSDEAVRSVRGNNGAPVVSVSGAGTTLFLHRVRIEDTDDVGVSVESSAVLYADSTQVVGNDGGGIELASDTSGFIRNSMLAGFGGNPGMPALSSNGATVQVLFSTLALPANFGGSPVECSGGSMTIRNSIIVNENNAPGSEVDCAGSTIDNSALRTTLSPADWFGSGFASADYFLNAAGQAEFDGEAVWEAGDPPFDFEGDARPTEDGASDFAGADSVP